MRTFLRSSFPAALLGGLVAAVAVFLATGGGGDDTTRTVVQQAPIARSTSASQAGSGLTARDIYRRSGPGVVNVRAQIVRRVDSPFEIFPEQEQRGQASGSGFVVDREGYVMTNSHVIEGASQVTVQFEDSKTATAKVVGKDNSTDLALLKVDPDGLRLRPLRLGDSRGVQVGDPTVAIGNPFGLDRTLTTGVVSALQRRIDAPNGFSISNVIQTDAAINPGNSGGPLLDAAGRVIGINSQIATGGAGQGSVGIGFAVPVNTAKTVMPQLKETGRVKRAFLGITGVTIDRSLERLNLSVDTGVLVQRVEPRSPAAKAGVRGGDAQATFEGTELALGGDVIVKLDGKPVRSMDTVIDEVNRHKPGESIELELRRDGKPRTVTVKLAERPDRAPAR